MENTNLTTRQWNLYNYIKKMTETTQFWVTKENILDNVEGYEEIDESKDQLNQKAFQQVRADIKKLRENATLQKMVITKYGGYRLAESQEEAEEYLKRQWHKIVGMIERAKIQEEKMKLDGQIRFVEDGSKARQYLEAYVRGE